MYQRAKVANRFSALFTKKDILITSLVSAGYLLLSTVLIGYKSDQLALVVLFNLLYYISFATRKFVTGFSVYIVYWIVFDYMKAFPNYSYNTINIESLYGAEKQLFGIDYRGQTVTPNEYWLHNTSRSLDLLSGFFYLCWVPVPLLFSAYLFFKNREEFMKFALTFFFVNILGFIVYYLYPAAAPWYVQLHGFTFYPNTAGNTAGLHRFDDIVNAPIFQSLYSKSSNVFAAMPSLHSSYPIIVVYYGFRNRMGWMNAVFAIIMVGIWFAAVYTSHHYVLDVVAGIVCAVIGIFIFEKLLVNNKIFYSIFITKLAR